MALGNLAIAMSKFHFSVITKASTTLRFAYMPLIYTSEFPEKMTDKFSPTTILTEIIALQSLASVVGYGDVIGKILGVVNERGHVDGYWCKVYGVHLAAGKK